MTLAFTKVVELANTVHTKHEIYALLRSNSIDFNMTMLPYDAPCFTYMVFSEWCCVSHNYHFLWEAFRSYDQRPNGQRSLRNVLKRMCVRRQLWSDRPLFLSFLICPSLRLIMLQTLNVKDPSVPELTDYLLSKKLVSNREAKIFLTGLSAEAFRSLIPQTAAFVTGSRILLDRHLAVLWDIISDLRTEPPPYYMSRNNIEQILKWGMKNDLRKFEILYQHLRPVFTFKKQAIANKFTMRRTDMNYRRLIHQLALRFFPDTITINYMFSPGILAEINLSHYLFVLATCPERLTELIELGRHLHRDITPLFNQRHNVRILPEHVSLIEEVFAAYPIPNPTLDQGLILGSKVLDTWNSEDPKVIYVHPTEGDFSGSVEERMSNLESLFFDRNSLFYVKDRCYQTVYNYILWCLISNDEKMIDRAISVGLKRWRAIATDSSSMVCLPLVQELMCLPQFHTPAIFRFLEKYCLILQANEADQEIFKLIACAVAGAPSSNNELAVQFAVNQLQYLFDKRDPIMHVYSFQIEETTCKSPHLNPIPSIKDLREGNRKWMPTTEDIQQMCQQKRLPTTDLPDTTTLEQVLTHFMMLLTDVTTACYPRIEILRNLLHSRQQILYINSDGICESVLKPWMESLTPKLRAVLNFIDSDLANVGQRCSTPLKLAKRSSKIPKVKPLPPSGHYIIKDLMARNAFAHDMQLTRWHPVILRAAQQMMTEAIQEAMTTNPGVTIALGKIKENLTEIQSLRYAESDDSSREDRISKLEREILQHARTIPSRPYYQNRGQAISNRWFRTAAKFGLTLPKEFIEPFLIAPQLKFSYCRSTWGAYYYAKHNPAEYTDILLDALCLSSTQACFAGDALQFIIRSLNETDKETLQNKIVERLSDGVFRGLVVSKQLTRLLCCFDNTLDLMVSLWQGGGVAVDLRAALWKGIFGLQRKITNPDTLLTGRVGNVLCQGSVKFGDNKNFAETIIHILCKLKTEEQDITALQYANIVTALIVPILLHKNRSSKTLLPLLSFIPGFIDDLQDLKDVELLVFDHQLLDGFAALLMGSEHLSIDLVPTFADAFLELSSAISVSELQTMWNSANNALWDAIVEYERLHFSIQLKKEQNCDYEPTEAELPSPVVKWRHQMLTYLISMVKLDEDENKSLLYLLNNIFENFRTRFDLIFPPTLAVGVGLYHRVPPRVGIAALKEDLDHLLTTEMAAGFRGPVESEAVGHALPFLLETIVDMPTMKAIALLNMYLTDYQYPSTSISSELFPKHLESHPYLSTKARKTLDYIKNNLS